MWALEERRSIINTLQTCAPDVTIRGVEKNLREIKILNSFRWKHVAKIIFIFYRSDIKLAPSFWPAGGKPTVTSANMCRTERSTRINTLVSNVM